MISGIQSPGTVRILPRPLEVGGDKDQVDHRPLPLDEVNRAQMLAACAGGPQVTADSDFQRHFARSSGWLGADGAYSLPLPDGRVLWLFSDTIVGEIGTDGKLQPGWGMLHNSFGVQNGPAMRLEARSLFPGRDDQSWYWVYSGKVQGQQAQVFLGSFSATNGPEGFNFQQNGAALANLKIVDGEPGVESITALPHFRPGPPPLHWGAAVVPHEGQQYVYGTRDFGNRKELVVARTPALSAFDQWTFWDGENWVANPEQATPLLDQVANELSVDFTQGQFRVLTQVGEEVHRHRAPSPNGPFVGGKVWKLPPHQAGVLTYNAKLHPHLSDERGPLLTYNQNVLPLQALVDDPGLYRPQCWRYRDSVEPG